MKIKFYSDDGKVFDTKKECVEYEENLKKKKEEKAAYEAKRDERYAEVLNAYKQYKKLLEEYLTDYDRYEYTEYNEDFPFLNALIKTFYS